MVLRFHLRVIYSVIFGGGGELLCSISETLKPCLTAYSFKTWPAFFQECVDLLLLSPVDLLSCRI